MVEEPHSDEELPGSPKRDQSASALHLGDVGDDVLKSLISVEGLHRSWRSVGARISSIDHRVKELERQMRGLPESYISRQDWLAVVEGHLESRLAEHSEQLGRIDAFSQELSTTVHETLNARFDGHSQRLDELAKTGDDVRLQSEDFMAKIQITMAETSEKFGEQIAGWGADIEQAKTTGIELRRDVSTAVHDIKEENAVLAVKCETAANAGPELLTSCQSDNIHQAKMLEFLDLHLVSELRRNLDKAREKMDAWSEKSMIQHKEARQAMHSVEEHVSVTCARLQTKFADWTVEVGNCPTRGEFDSAQVQIRDDTQSLAADVSNLNVTAVNKMNELIGHVTNMHEMLRTHECALKIHSEELESRGTKYDVLMCQTQIDRCAVKVEIDREIRELKSAAEWQSKKMEHFATGIAMGGTSKFNSRKSRKTGGPGGRLLKALAAARSSIAVRPTSVASSSMSARKSYSGGVMSGAMSRTSSGLSGVNGSMAEEYEESEASRTEAGGSDQDAKERGNTPGSGTAVVRAPSALKSSRPESPEEPDGSEIHEDHSNPESSEEDEDETPANSFLLQTQLEALSMGLVGLAHMALRDPVLGTSRSVRLGMEKELLEQLRKLRHWITHKSEPDGWTPQNMTTFALRCAHPRPDEVWNQRSQLATSCGVEPDRTLSTSHSTLAGPCFSQSTLAETSVESRPATAPTQSWLAGAGAGLGGIGAGNGTKSGKMPVAATRPVCATLGVSGRPVPLSARGAKVAGQSLPPLRSLQGP